jgi:Tfp pilus assembly protein PilX
MKIRTNKEAGTMLVAALVISAILGTALASYMGVVRSQHRSVARSMEWNRAIPIAEAGVEEAMAHLNHNTNRSASGWNLVGTNHTKIRTFGGARYEVTITTNFLRPVITAKAFVKVPMSTNVIKRGIRVACTNRAVAIKGMLAKGKMYFGGTVLADSFDSTDTNKSTGAMYDPAKKQANSYLGTNGKTVGAIEVNGSAQVYGSVATGPTGTIVATGGATVGDAAHVSGGGSGIQSGHSANDMNVFFPDVEVPFTSGYSTPIPLPVLGYPYGGTNYLYSLGDGTYQMSSLSMSAPGNNMVITGHAILYVTGNISISGHGFIYIAPGASLSLYVGGTTTSIAGKGLVNSGPAKSFKYMGLPTNTSVSFSGNGTFAGVIYAPHAALTLAGTGSNPLDFTGASTSSTVTMSGGFNFHYDESLANTTDALYIASSWDELPYTEL